MRLFNTVLALLALTASTVAYAADDALISGGAQTSQDAQPVARDDVETQASFDAVRKSSNSANDPTEPRLTLEYWNYYAPSLNNLNGTAENGEGRVLIPYQTDGVQQLFHIDPPIVTNPTAKTGPRTGLGDAQIYNLTLFKHDIGLYEHEPITFGIGPLIAAPTNTNTNFGTKQPTGWCRRRHHRAPALGTSGGVGDLSAHGLGGHQPADHRAAERIL